MSAAELARRAFEVAALQRMLRVVSEGETPDAVDVRVVTMLADSLQTDLAYEIESAPEVKP